MNDVYILKEDMEMENDYYGVKSGGGVAKAGTKFELLKEPRPEKKMYKLRPIGVKFPYNLNLRPNVFKRYFEKFDDSIS